VSHSRFGCREEVDSRLLVVRSQIVSLTPGPSFAHNSGYKCPNDQCEAILDMYISRPFQNTNARCFGLCCRTLNIRESRRTPNPQLWEWEFHPPTSPKVGLRQNPISHHFVTSSKIWHASHFTTAIGEACRLGQVAMCRQWKTCCVTSCYFNSPGPFSTQP